MGWNRPFSVLGKEPFLRELLFEFFERRLTSRNAQLEAKTEEKEKIREKYEADLERYRLLKAENE